MIRDVKLHLFLFIETLSQVCLSVCHHQRHLLKSKSQVSYPPLTLRVLMRNHLQLNRPSVNQLPSRQMKDLHPDLIHSVMSVYALVAPQQNWARTQQQVIIWKCSFSFMSFSINSLSCLSVLISLFRVWKLLLVQFSTTTIWQQIWEFSKLGSTIYKIVYM